MNLGSGKSIELKKLVKIIADKLKMSYNLSVNKKKDKLVSNNSLLYKTGFKLKNEKNFNI